MSENIIKARTVDGPFRVVSIKREVHEASIEARQIVEEARATASGILEKAKREREATLAAARRDGYEAGLAEWNEILAEALRLRDDYIARNEPELVKLAVAIAEKILSQELKTNPGAVLGTVRAALRSVRREKDLVIQVNPGDESVVRDRLSSLRELVGGGHELSVVLSPSIAPGGCVVESEIGIIDAQVSTQLKALEQALLRNSRKTAAASNTPGEESAHCSTNRSPASAGSALRGRVKE